MGLDSSPPGRGWAGLFPRDGMFVRLTLRAGVVIIGLVKHLIWPCEGGDDEGN